ncbi:MAG: hypothetical protein COW03_14990 [Cytophagales bacterium CG12_big_fil_rev_8_21_14_0_65_40_12]|nr:MAG: hypothetical protein COW03_14990 [Cytophagales bacterium CG12_big_fil_rev_8_21_14_0_65_40_12]PIW03395.1 MAG: hypothetical protein COW40_14645 [Cytophagales bacterium CG17_big_fil_post_rev_8_21_14_2_50_40_13]
MKISIKVLAVISLFLLSNQAFSQGRVGFNAIEDEEDYKIENVFGFGIATNSGLLGSLFFRHSVALQNNNLSHYGVEIANTRHNREYRQTSFNGSTFVIGKSNYLVSIRPYYGREKIFFQKAPQQGMRISGLISAGPTLGLEAPYFVNLSNGNKEQYDPDIHSVNSINGNSGPFKGLFKSNIVPGVHMKASLTFETTSTKSRVFGVQVGFNVEGFTRKIEIIPAAENKSAYSAAFFSVYFGKRR